MARERHGHGMLRVNWPLMGVEFCNICHRFLQALKAGFAIARLFFNDALNTSRINLGVLYKSTDSYWNLLSYVSALA
jgi:hypothetical protein